MPPKSNPSRRRVLFYAGAATMLASGFGQASAQRVGLPVKPDRPIRFDVMRLGDVIGFHTVTFEGSASRFSALTEIEIRVSILGVTLFDFRNHCVERWRDGRLQSLDSRTKDDDSDFVVTGRASGDGFTVEGRRSSVKAPADVMASTYWSQTQFSRDQVIDTKRGSLRPQSVRERSRASLTIGGVPMEVDRLDVVGVIDGTIDYDDAGRWVGAKFHRRDSDIVYRLRI